jgi:hypothetical protein
MKTRTFSILAVLALALVLAAIFANKHDAEGASPGSGPGHEQGAKFFGDLSQHVNDVAQVTVAAPEATRETAPAAGPDGAPPPVPPSTSKTFEITKQGDAWGATEKGGYPVDAGKVKQLVVGLSELTTLEPMTKNKSYYAKLGVEDITEPKAASKRVTLKDSGGKVLADVLIGQSARAQGSNGSKPSLYVRRVGEEQAFEVSGSLNVAADASGWLDLDITKLESARVNRVVTSHPGGELLEVMKNAPEDKDFSVVGLPAGEELMWPGVADPIAGALQYLRLEDVQKNENFDMSGATTAEFTTFDGMRVTVKTVEKDGKTWATLSAAFDPSLRVEAPTVVAPPPEGDKPPDAAATPPPTPPKAARKSEDEVKKEVDELNKKCSPWVYVVPGYGAANLRKHMTDLLKKKEEPKADAALKDALNGDAPLEPIGTPPAPIKNDGDH